MKTLEEPFFFWVFHVPKSAEKKTYVIAGRPPEKRTGIVANIKRKSLCVVSWLGNVIATNFYDFTLPEAPKLSCQHPYCNQSWLYTRTLYKCIVQSAQKI